MSSRCDSRTCPDYRLRLFGDGAVIYTGIDTVNVRGDAASKISQAELQNLKESFRAANFFELASDYTPRAGFAANLSRIELTFRDGEKEKTVKFTQYDIPGRLHTLVTVVNDATNAKQWICPFRRNAGGDLICPL